MRYLFIHDDGSFSQADSFSTLDIQRWDAGDLYIIDMQDGLELVGRDGTKLTWEYIPSPVGEFH